MKPILLFCILLAPSVQVKSQTFIRTELPTALSTPWEITCGPDNFLWLTESGGKVVRVDPADGSKTVVYTAPDYFPGSPLENSLLCPEFSIGAGTLGLALHPDFMDSSSSYIYYVYSYNSGSASAPATKFRVKRLKWSAATNSVVSDTNVVNSISTGYDHLGGRLMAIKQNGTSYLFLSVGDNGRSEQNSPECYSPQSTNPNNFAQDVTTLNGKIHRFNVDGSIPSDNPIAGNSFFTRGHRNPQGLMYNPTLDLVYDIEHGDRTDDEINVLYKGMNYGWKNVRGYRDDNSYPGEGDFAANYVPDPSVPNDSLVDPLFAWCTTAVSSEVPEDWCTVAPSGGIYYGSDGIPQWKNSLLVVTLKEGVSTEREVYQFKLQASGELVPSTASDPNPKKFFGEDQALNGRLRDIAVSTDGRSIYLINNGGTDADKITVYQVDTATFISVHPSLRRDIQLFPNPVGDMLTIEGLDNDTDLLDIQITTLLGTSTSVAMDQAHRIDVSGLTNGIHFIHLIFKSNTSMLKFIKN